MVGFLYGQTEYQMLENTIHLADYIKKAQVSNYAFLSITDSNLSGHFKFYQACKEANIKPVIGLKVFLETHCDKKNALLIYAKNKVGYHNLVRIATESELHKEVSLEFLQSHHEGLFFVSSALDSNLDYYIFEKKEALVKEELKRLQSLGEFYLGIMPSSFIYDTIYLDLKNLIEKENLIALPLQKTSYLEEDDLVLYQTLLKLNEEEIIPGFDDLHFMSKEELVLSFSDFPTIFDNLDKVIKSIDDEVISFNHPLPKYPNKFNLSSKDYLEGLCKKGLEKRLIGKNKDLKVYQERLNYELDVINKMGYADYFLIVWDFVLFAKKHGVLVGPGRGSACGSLVSYSLGITEIDPLEYDLLFERFLNPERVSMPDIDLDFPDDKRDFVINYVKEKYGIDHVSYITAFGSFQLKSSIRDLFRINGYDQKYIEPIIKLLSENASAEKIHQEFKLHRELIELIEIAGKITNLPRHISTHAAGIILASNSLFEEIPLRLGLNGMYQAQLEASDLEKLGLLKIDFLGIRNLTIIDNIVKEIKKENKDFNINKIPLDDELTFKLLQSGDTLGIFQLESAGITKVLKQMKPTEFEDLVAVLALYRPGPMENIGLYISRKHGEKFDYLHEDLEPILKDTYGIIVYQEQIMKIALKFAGYTLGEADILRRAVSKKKLETLELEREKFVSRSVKHGYSLEVANNIYDYIVKFANYGFNRSHSAAYGLFSYQMAYLKANYKDIFLAKLLNNVIGNDSELKNYISYCNLNKINVLPPNINYSTHEFRIMKTGLLMPLNAIHNIGTIATKAILSERANGLFKDFKDFKSRMSAIINSRMFESLINSGAFDCFNLTHSFLLKSVNLEFEDYFDEDEINHNVLELSKEELALNEFEALGFNLRFNPFKDYLSLKAKFKATDPSDLVLNKLTNVIGLITRVKELKTKKNEMMAFVTLNCNNELLDVVVFTRTYNLYQDLLSSKKLVLMQGIVQKRNDALQLSLNRIKEL